VIVAAKILAISHPAGRTSVQISSGRVSAGWWACGPSHRTQHASAADWTPIMSQRLSPTIRALLLACAFAAGGTVTLAQMVQPAATVGGGDTPTSVSEEEIPEWIRPHIIDPQSAPVRAWAAQQKVRKSAEKELKKLRFAHFGQRRGQARQEGIVKMREYVDAAYFPMLLDIFGEEGVDVRTALLDHFRDHEGREGDACLGWMAIFDPSDEIRAAALDRVRDRTRKLGKTPDEVKLAAYQGLTSRNDKIVRNACGVVNSLGIIEAIPWLINGQVQGPRSGGAGTGSGGVGSGQGALAWIAVGTQTAFVSDLTPVVGPNAVAFDPELSVVTDGTVLRVIDAVVITYSVDMNSALTDMSSREWGQSTREFGWNTPLWRKWYTEVFTPFLAAREAEKAKVQQAAEAAATNPAAPAGPG